MAWLKNHPLFITIISALALVLVLEIFFLFNAIGEANAAATRVEQRERELAEFAYRRPFPDPSNATAIAADAAAAERARDSMRAELLGRGNTARQLLAARPPAARTDAFFDLASYVQRMTAQADAAGVETRVGERFGFSAYTNVGPDPELIPGVFRQRQVLQYALESLFAAGPLSLVSVNREQIRSAAEQEAHRVALESGIPLPPPTGASFDAQGDYFVIDPMVSARVEGFVDTKAFRIAFTGQTATLRKFLNRLAEFELPLVVRSVEVGPEGGADRLGRGPQAAPVRPRRGFGGGFGAMDSEFGETPAETELPIVRENVSQFTVTLEFVDLIAARASAESPPPAPQVEDQLGVN